MRYIISCFLAVFLNNTAYSKPNEPVVILLSIDGFSFDYLQKYKPKNIISLVNSGIKAKLRPVYPSKTFPNHLSIITGTYPAKHGIINNTFFSPTLGTNYYKGAGKNNSTWLNATPFWSVAEQQGLKTAVYFWPESEAIGHSPTYNVPFNKKDSNKARLDQVINWLRLPLDQRPQFIASYFSSVDSAGHHYGPNSKELIKAIADIDLLIGNFINKLAEEVPFDVNIILVSDHGMLELADPRVIKPSMIFDESLLKLITANKINIAINDTQLYLNFRNSEIAKFESAKIFKVFKDKKRSSKLYHVYLKGDYPKHWNFDENINLIPDVIIEAIPPSIFVKENFNSKRLNRGTHGFDAINHPDLMGMFIATGPNIVKSKKVEEFENIHVFPFMSELLAIKSTKEIDGKLTVLAPYITYK
jgi:predicted AlkP superfamily pyrophosphatase or phosphodiesterase